MQIWSPSPILTNVDFQYVILGTFLKCLVVKKSVAISGRYIHIKTGLIRQCTKLKFGKKFFHRNLSGRVQKQQEMLILSKQAITFDIMATEIFFIHQDIGLKFFEHVLQINDNKITGGIDRFLLSSFPIAHATQGYFYLKSRNVKLHKMKKKQSLPKSSSK